MTRQLQQQRPYPGVLLPTFNRPERKNALDDVSTRAFIDAITASNMDTDTRVVVTMCVGGVMGAANMFEVY